MIKTQVTPRWESEIYNVEIEPKQSIRLYGLFKNVYGAPRPYDITFKIGDSAEYDSYNLKYTGIITSIGAKTVIITDYHNGCATPEAHRLDLAHFANRNWDYDAEKIAAYNREESYYI
jgi:hypothetical protein